MARKTTPKIGSCTDTVKTQSEPVKNIVLDAKRKPLLDLREILFLLFFQYATVLAY